jgi:hypothetical protein
MSNLPDFSNWTGPASSGSVSESAGGNCEMSTFVPIEARGGMMLQPGPGPFAAGPGPFPPCNSPPSSCSCLSLSAADAAAEENMSAAAAVAMSTAFALFDNLVMLALLRSDVCSLQVLRKVATDVSAVNPQDSECGQELQDEQGWLGRVLQNGPC